VILACDGIETVPATIAFGTEPAMLAPAILNKPAPLPANLPNVNPFAVNCN